MAISCVCFFLLINNTMETVTKGQLVVSNAEGVVFPSSVDAAFGDELVWLL